MKWYLAQMISGPDTAANLAAVQRHLIEAQRQGCDAVQLPEMFARFGTSKNADIADFEADFNGPVGAPLRDWARQYRLWIVAGTVPVRVAGEERPRARLHVLDADGELRAQYDKIHLFDATVGDAQGRYRESDYYQPGETDAKTVDTPWGRWGLSVCYDLRFPELYRRLRADGADTLLAPSAFTFTTGQAHWELLCRARAVENGCYLVAANQGGQHDAKRHSWGHSLMADPWGEVVQLGEGETGLCVETDMARLAEVRRNLPSWDNRRF
ncbi:carbon-nitrogen hydrolase family protein [Saccharospirillum mangrovi]|uniref:carbon-nitrogen hydrolase family protein n=1 Tax=Saccharospirillum mangrovi TaxID=2161747 RepID=UPI000D369F81|nr:carbon-nitrogen hydrolase family protein [Saccharospirillum mangrovi]